MAEPMSPRLEALPVHEPVHHCGYVVADLGAGIESLEAHGMPVFLRAGLGDIRFAYHDASHLLGHHIELHQDGPALQGFFGMINGAREGWDGSDPIRSAAG